jgi:hypothetical protein
MGLAKNKLFINIYLNFKKIQILALPTVIPWGQTHAQTDKYLLNILVQALTPWELVYDFDPLLASSMKQAS